MQTTIATEVVEAVAAEKGVDPTDFDVALSDAVSPAALESLAAHDRDAWALAFVYAGHEVTVKGNGAVLVDDRRRGTWTRDHARPTSEVRPSDA